MTTTRIAVIGLGMAVKPHARSLIDLRDRVEVIAAYSPTEARRAKFAAEYGMRVSDDLDAIFADRTISAVMLLTPPNTHLELVQRAARAGKHILLEKPLDITTARARALVEAAEAAGVRLGVVLQNRFRPNSVALAKLLAEGRLGRLISASARLFNWRPQSYYDEPGRGTRARDGGGVMLTQGIHTLDLLVSLVGLPAEVSAYVATSPVHRMETEDIVAAALRYPGGGMGTLNATTCAFPGFPEQIEIVGEHGTALTRGEELHAQFKDGTEVRVGEAIDSDGAGADPMAFAHDSHRAVLADFLDAMEQDRQPRASGRDVLKAHRLIDAILDSAGSGRPVSIDKD